MYRIYAYEKLQEDSGAALVPGNRRPNAKSDARSQENRGKIELIPRIFPEACGTLGRVPRGRKRKKCRVPWAICVDNDEKNWGNSLND